MPIDSRDKRASTISIIPAIYIMPDPDGTISQADRQQLAYAYCGIAAAFEIMKRFVRAVISGRAPRAVLGSARGPRAAIALRKPGAEYNPLR